tara:strand:- start:237 stop:605 length:369 start_codon:yes stop_codon:yes gene_type:complete
VNKIIKIEHLFCHCKTVQVEIKLEKELKKLTRCNCSFCKRRGAIMGIIKLENLKVIKGNDKLSVYKFGRKQHAEHYFCSICGIYTHHRSYSNPKNFEFNVACIDNIDTFKYKDIPIFDGEKL